MNYERHIRILVNQNYFQHFFVFFSLQLHTITCIFGILGGDEWCSYCGILPFNYVVGTNFESYSIVFKWRSICIVKICWLYSQKKLFATFLEINQSRKKNWSFRWELANKLTSIAEKKIHKEIKMRSCHVQRNERL